MKKNAVVMACDENYAPFAFCVAEQIVAINSDRNFDICIFTNADIKIPTTFKSANINLVKLIEKNPFDEPSLLTRHGSAAYLRLIIPSYISGRYDKILYLDSDILIQGGDLNRLFEVNLHGHAIAAVRDNQQWRTPNRKVKEFTALSLAEAPYFNSGVLLIDVQKFQELEILERATILFRKYPQALIRQDQSLLNILLHGNWAELSPLWNWQYTRDSRFYITLAEPYIVHFIGPLKPWNDQESFLPISYRSFFFDFLIKHYPGRPENTHIGQEAICWPDNITTAFAKHLISIKKMRNYLAKFSDPYISIEHLK